MVTTTTHYSDARYRSNAGEGFDGVVRVYYGGYYGSGTLLFDGRAILTSAHLFAGRSGTASVSFETVAGTQTLTAQGHTLHPAYDGDGNNDLALVWLSGAAPIGADRYGIYRDEDEVGQRMTLVGYGRNGTGNTGATSSEGSPLLRLQAANRFDAEAVHPRSAGWARPSTGRPSPARSCSPTSTTASPETTPTASSSAATTSASVSTRA